MMEKDSSCESSRLPARRTVRRWPIADDGRAGRRSSGDLPPGAVDSAGTRGRRAGGDGCVFVVLEHRLEGGESEWIYRLTYFTSVSRESHAYPGFPSKLSGLPLRSFVPYTCRPLQSAGTWRGLAWSKQRAPRCAGCSRRWTCARGLRRQTLTRLLQSGECSPRPPRV